MHHADDVVDPDAREVGIDEFAAVLEDILKVQFRAVIFAHCRGKSAARHRGRAAGGAPLGDLDDGDAGFRAFKCRHGAGRAAANDQYIRRMAYYRNIKLTGAACHLVGESPRLLSC